MRRPRRILLDGAILLTERWAYRFEVLALIGMGLLLLGRFTAIPWLNVAGWVLIAPIGFWVFIMYGLVAPILIVAVPVLRLRKMGKDKIPPT